MPCGMMQRQNRAHGKSTNHNAVAAGFEAIVLAFHGRVPVRPPRCLEVVAAAAMSGELGHMHGMSGVIEPLRDIAHLQWRPAQPMDEQQAEASSRQANALIHTSLRPIACGGWMLG